MSSSRVLICDFCLLLVCGLRFVSTEETSSNSTAAIDQIPKGNCSCGGFPTVTPVANSEPLVSQTPDLKVSCNVEGDNTCKALCTALATATKAKGPEVLCRKLKDAVELKLSAFYKVCSNPWTYASMTADEPLCCEESKVKLCASAAAANTTTIVEDVTKSKPTN